MDGYFWDRSCIFVFVCICVFRFQLRCPRIHSATTAVESRLACAVPSGATLVRQLVEAAMGHGPGAH